MSKVPYTEQDVQTAKELTAQGYRRTSWKCTSCYTNRVENV